MRYDSNEHISRDKTGLEQLPIEQVFIVIFYHVLG